MTTPASTFAQEPLPAYRDYPQPEMIERARSFHAGIVRHRTVRDFNTQPAATRSRQCVRNAFSFGASHSRAIRNSGYATAA